MSIDDQNDELNDALETRLGQLAAAIEAHEKALKAMKIPRDVWCCYDSDDIVDDNGQSTGQTYDYYIGMIKWQGTWRLCHATRHCYDQSDSDWKPLVDSSISDRLRAAKHFDKLRNRIIEDKKKVIPQIEAAIEGLVKSLESSDAKSN